MGKPNGTPEKKRKKRPRRKRSELLPAVLLLLAGVCALYWFCDIRPARHKAETSGIISQESPAGAGTGFLPEGLPENLPGFNGRAYIQPNNGRPFFRKEDTDQNPDLQEGNDLSCSPLDSLGRCGSVTAVISRDTMPDEERESLREIYPSGWMQAEYDFIDGGYLYNRCHLVGYQLCGDNGDERNLITGTRYMNITGMQPWEDWAAEYARRSGGHILYRVTPVFEGSNLLASGVLMEAVGLENPAFRFCVYCYNVQPGVGIDYRTGSSEALDEVPAAGVPSAPEAIILNTNSGKYHLPSCSAVREMAWRNRIEWLGSAGELKSLGYTPCSLCAP